MTISDISIVLKTSKPEVLSLPISFSSFIYSQTQLPDLQCDKHLLLSVPNDKVKK